LLELFSARGIVPLALLVTPCPHDRERRSRSSRTIVEVKKGVKRNGDNLKSALLCSFTNEKSRACEAEPSPESRQ